MLHTCRDFNKYPYVVLPFRVFHGSIHEESYKFSLFMLSVKKFLLIFFIFSLQ